jgi:hypothetical protein
MASMIRPGERLMLLEDGQHVAGWILEPGDVGTLLAEDAPFVLFRFFVAFEAHATRRQRLDGLVDVVYLEVRVARGSRIRLLVRESVRQSTGSRRRRPRAGAKLPVCGQRRRADRSPRDARNGRDALSSAWASAVLPSRERSICIRRGRTPPAVAASRLRPGPGARPD